MNKKITKSTKPMFQGKSEKLLLLAIMAIGVLGLTFSYGSKKADSISVSASASDSTGSDGKVQSDRMILHLNQKGTDEEKSKNITRF